MLENVRFYSFLSKKNIATLLNLIFLLFVYSIAQGSEKIKIINNFNTLNTLKFDFTQKSFDNEENGVCYLKRPYFFKCLYKDKNQKELIINNRVLVIYHKRYNKIYRYPLSKSYFMDILNREKFSKLIMDGESFLNSNYIEIKYRDINKGKISLFFDKSNFNLLGWELIDINNNVTILEIKNYLKNIEINKNFFLIPEENQ